MAVGLAMTHSLWAELRNFFEEDDGSLPEIRLTYGNGGAVIAACAKLQDMPGAMIVASASHWDNQRHQEIPIDSLCVGAERVVAKTAEPFHVVLHGLLVDGAKMPDLGIFVFPNQLAIDFRKGVCWNAPTVTGLFGIFADLAALDETSTLTLEDHVSAEDHEKFRLAWHTFLSAT